MYVINFFNLLIVEWGKTLPKKYKIFISNRF